MKFTLALDSSPSKRTIDANGYLHVSLTPISKAAVNPYLGREIPNWKDLGLEPESLYYGLRDPDELEAAASTFNGLPLLIGHHYESADNPQKEHRVGSLGTDAVYEEPYLMNSLSITDKEAIQAIEEGTCKELSAGYRYKPDFTSGEYQGVSYDFVMRNIEGNHVALVPEGRAGRDVVVADEKPAEIKEIERSQEQMNKDKNKNPIAQDGNLETGAVTTDSAIDLTKSVEELLSELFPNAEGEALENAKKILSQLKATQGATDSDPAAIAEDDDAITNLMSVLKGFTREEMWAVSDALLNLQSEAKGQDVLAKIVQALKGGTVDEGLNLNNDGTPATATDEGNDEELNPTGAQDQKLAMDAAIRAAENRMMTKVRNLNTAALECRQILGSQYDPMAYDSAEDIYGKALKIAGFEIKDFPSSAYRGMVVAYQKNNPAVTSIAMDAQPFKTNGKVPGNFEGLLNIEVR